MRPVTKTVLKFFLGLAIILLVSAFLAPWIHHLLPFFKFDRIFRRLIMIGTFLLTVWILRERWDMVRQLGLQEWRKKGLRLLGFGFLCGLFLAGGLSLIQWALGVRVVKIYETDLWYWLGFFLKGFGAGTLIGAIEEFFFRGFLFLTLKDLWNTRISLIVTNFIYAVVHFFPKDKLDFDPNPTIEDSFRLLGAVLSSFWVSLQQTTALGGLFLFGLLLSFVFLQTRTLYPSIGIHAGAVFTLKMNRRFIPEISEKMDFLSGSRHLYDGIIGLVVLALLCLILGRKVRSEIR